MNQQNWTKKLTVDKRIVRLLSASTYETFPDAIREMVSNAYDADATEVKINIDFKQDFIRIEDNGNGMTPAEFDFFLRIAGQKRDKKRISSEFGRKQIGQFGIGFLAIFPFGKQVEVTSTATRSDLFFRAVIPADQYVHEGVSIDVENIPIPGYEYKDSTYIDQHGTTIQINGLTEMVKRYFKSDIRINKRRKTIKSLDPFERFKWALQEDLPLDYSTASPYRNQLKDLGASGIRIWLNDAELFRNSPGSQILETKIWEYKNIKCRYVIATNWKVITPDEAQGYKIRLRNVGIGKRTSFDLGLLGKKYSRLAWLSGDVYIIDGLENLLAIDRSKFVEGPDYDEFSEYLRNRLAYHANRVEQISEAERDIHRQVNESRTAEVGSKLEIINQKINQLENKGFEVIRKSSKEVQKSTDPITVDVQHKVIQIIEDHPKLSDSYTSEAEKIPLRYTKWDTKTQLAVRRGEDNAIEINSDYPLFSSKRYGDVFKKTLLLAFLLSEQTKTASELFQALLKELPGEFEDFLK
jgi:hypothetical protein